MLAGEEFGFEMTRRVRDQLRREWFTPTHVLLCPTSLGEGVPGIRIERYDGVDFQPGEHETFWIPDGDGVSRRMLNVWNDPKWGDIEDTRADLRFLADDLVHYLCNGDKAAAKFILDWMAHAVQRPGERANHGVLILGKQGIGKTSIAELMALLVGLENASKADPKQMQGSFQSWINGKTLVQVDEVYADGNWELANAMKRFLTDERLAVNIKVWAAVDDQECCAVLHVLE
jgi:hypothetical protein